MGRFTLLVDRDSFKEAYLQKVQRMYDKSPAGSESK